MSFIIIECHGGAEYAIICTDENGIVLVFNAYEEAKVEANECQDGRIVEI